jgi:hypothetical protein
MPFFVSAYKWGAARHLSLQAGLMIRQHGGYKHIQKQIRERQDAFGGNSGSVRPYPESDARGRWR